MSTVPIIASWYYDSLLGLYKVIGESKRALEVGLGWGTSAQAYLDTWIDAKLDTIDQEDYHDVFAPLKKEYEERINIIKGRSPEVYTFYFLKKYDYIFIDSAHDYMSVMNDIQNTWPHLKKGGVMALDDYGVEGKTEEGLDQGVKRAVDEFFKGKKSIFLECNIIAFRKE